jgi:hypothetical protein
MYLIIVTSRTFALIVGISEQKYKVLIVIVADNQRKRNLILIENYFILKKLPNCTIQIRTWWLYMNHSYFERLFDFEWWTTNISEKSYPIIMLLNTIFIIIDTKRLISKRSSSILKVLLYHSFHKILF